MTQPRKSITDRYNEASNKIDKGQSLTGKDIAIVTLVRTKELTVAAGSFALSVILLPVTLTCKAGSYLKRQWQQVTHPQPENPPPPSAPKPDKPAL